MLFKSKSLMSSLSACVRNMLKNVIFVIGKLKFVFFSLVLRYFACLDPKLHFVVYVCMYKLSIVQR